MNQPAVDKAQATLQPGGAVRKKRRPTGGLECQLGVLIGLGGLVGSRLGQLWVAFDVFSQFTLQFAVVALAFLVGLFMPRAKLLAAFILIVVGVIGIGTWPHLASEAPQTLATPAEGMQEIRVASYNTLYDNENIDAVKAEVARLDADVITLLEMGPKKRRIMAELKDRYPYQADCYKVDYCNLVVLSKFPIVESDARGPLGGPAYIRAKLGPEAGGLTVFGVHTIRFPHSRAQFRQVNAGAPADREQPGPQAGDGRFQCDAILADCRGGRAARQSPAPDQPAELAEPRRPAADGDRSHLCLVRHHPHREPEDRRACRFGSFPRHLENRRAAQAVICRVW